MAQRRLTHPACAARPAVPQIANQLLMAFNLGHVRRVVVVFTVGAHFLQARERFDFADRLLFLRYGRGV